MAQQTINLGANANDKTGDTLRAGGAKINDNFTELYSGGTKIRVVIGAIKAGATPTQLEVDTAVGLTAAQAGSGYTIYIEFTTGTSYYGLFISNGTNWRRIELAQF